MEIVNLEKMCVRDLIVYYLRSEKKDHMAHRDAIIEYVRSSQPEYVKKGYRTPSGLTSLMSKLKKEGILSSEGREKGYYALAEERWELFRTVLLSDSKKRIAHFEAEDFFLFCII